MATDTNRIVQYEKSIKYIFRVVMIGSGVFMLFVKLILPYFIDVTYHESLDIVPLSLIGVVANSSAGFIVLIGILIYSLRDILTSLIISIAKKKGR